MIRRHPRMTWVAAAYFLRLSGFRLRWNIRQRALDVKVGDKVLFGKYAGQTVKVQGEELLVMREEDIMGVVEGK